MKPGQLRDRVRVDRRGQDSIDEMGNPAPATFEQYIAAQPCQIKPIRGDEQTIADRLTGVVVYEVVLRWTPQNASIMANDRLVITRSGGNLPNGTRLNVRHRPVNPDERKKYLTLQVSDGDLEDNGSQVVT